MNGDQDNLRNLSNLFERPIPGTSDPNRNDPGFQDIGSDRYLPILINTTDGSIDSIGSICRIDKYLYRFGIR